MRGTGVRGWGGEEEVEGEEAKDENGSINPERRLGGEKEVPSRLEAVDDALLKCAPPAPGRDRPGPLAGISSSSSIADSSGSSDIRSQGDRSKSLITSSLLVWCAASC